MIPWVKPWVKPWGLLNRAAVQDSFSCTRNQCSSKTLTQSTTKPNSLKRDFIQKWG
jgi:hypothetical protein